MASTPNAALLKAFEGMQENSYSTWAAFTLATYDFLITFPYELRLVWRRPWNATNVLFLTTRWIMVAGAIAVVAPKAPTSNCKVVLWVDQILGYISFAQTAAFSALRIFAIWNRNYALAAVIFALGCVPIAGNIYLAGFHNTISFVSRPVSECIETITVSEDNLMMASHTVAECTVQTARGKNIGENGGEEAK
ncbi:hypothetical protein PsYK624_066000 [Phanerochaete sordida]|uniref:DUF6533 domain-containing protein n=1 Tax=Phanerochaete sordida TaxID=48140 RepID=A0A9P3G9U8_9APHY|nr:hypothetical protein PsYK624_066000 [Phanerochaete sordida]